MCRIFGFRSVINSQVHHSLVNADNALHLQSQEHPDGWGVAYFVNASPHIIKSEKTAIEDSLFQRVSGVVASNTVVAHIRNATLGPTNILNTHPFQLGKWVFAHNGNIKNYQTHKNLLQELVAPELKRYILGDTDSEVIFFILLTEIMKIEDLNDVHQISILETANQSALSKITAIVGNTLDDDKGPPDQTYLSYIITNGELMLANQGGKNLYYSTHKKRCKERDTCSFFSEACENPVQNGQSVNHLIVSSEPLSGENIWNPLKFNSSVGVDSNMKLLISS